MATPTTNTSTMADTIDTLPADSDDKSHSEMEYMYQVQALANYDSKEPDDLKFKKNETLFVFDDSRSDGWLLAFNENGEQGLIPGNYVTFKLNDQEQYNDALIMQKRSVAIETEQSDLAGANKSLWDKLRQEIKPDATTALNSFSADLVPGFRPSGLDLLTKDSKYSLSSHLKPILSESGLTIVDPCIPIKMQPAFDKEITILYASKVPEYISGTECHREFRVCVYHKETSVITNILTSPAQLSSDDNRTWKSSKFAYFPNTKELLILIEKADPGYMLIFELAITRQESTNNKSVDNEISESKICSGWCGLQIFNFNGTPAIENKMYSLPLNGGKLFEQDIPLDPYYSISKRKSRLLQKQGPTMFLRFSPISRASKYLSASIRRDTVIPKSYLPLVHRYQQMTSSLLRKGSVIINAPEIEVFLSAVDNLVVMGVALVIWNTLNQNKRTLGSSNSSAGKQINSADLQIEQMRMFLLQRIYPLLVCDQFIWDLDGSRQAIIDSIMEETDMEQTLFLSKHLSFTPLQAEDHYINFTVQ